ncbi:MAG: 4a-hydroxytetrahydrobiopterin dehydratase, partial [Thiogranum sp.]
MSDTALTDRHCQRETSQLDSGAVQVLMTKIHADWSTAEDGGMIRRSFRFDNYHQTIAFVNALAWIAHRQDHHP